MADCPWPSRPDPCNDCWAEIYYHIAGRHATSPILPKPGFCQDAAFVAHMWDATQRDLKTAVEALGKRLKEADTLQARITELEGGEATRIAEIFDEARQEAAEADER